MLTVFSSCLAGSAVAGIRCSQCCQLVAGMHPVCRSACRTAHNPADDCPFFPQSVDDGVIVGVAIDAVGDV